MKRKLFRISYKITIIAIFLTVASTSTLGFFAYTYYRDHSINMLSDELISVAKSAATLIDPAQYREIMASMEKNDYHRWLSAQFTQLVEAHGIMFLHAGPLDPDTGYLGFVEADIPGFGTDLGETLPATNFSHHSFETMAQGIATVTEPVNASDYNVEMYGAIIIAAYAPVFDENGETIAIVSATLIDTGVYADSNLFAREMLGVALLTILVLITIPIIFASRAIDEPLSKLSAATTAIVEGDLSVELKIRSNDELGRLSDNFTLMQASIREREEAKKAAHQAELDKGRAEAVAETMLSSARYASKIQRNLLPSAETLAGAFSDCSVIWEPRDLVGGDIYWIKQYDKGTVLCVADCTGHGTPGALLTTLVTSALGIVVRQSNYKDPADIIHKLDRRLSEALNVESQTAGERKVMDIDDGCDIAVLFVEKGGSVTLSSGKMSVFVCDGKEVRQYKGQKIFVGEGKLKSKEQVEVIRIPASAENKFYVASDGLFEQVGGEEATQYGRNAFKQIILDNHNERQSVITAKVWEAFEEYRGGEARRDDFELIAFKP